MQLSRPALPHFYPRAAAVLPFAADIPYNFCGNPLLHTGVMYGFWRDWDGTPFDEVPLFYHGLTPLGAETLEGMWNELKATNEGLAKALGLEEPPSALRRIHSVVLERYSAVVGDPSTMFTSLRTNGAYAYTIHPVRPTGARPGWLAGWLALQLAPAPGLASLAAPPPLPPPPLPLPLPQMQKDPVSGKLIPNFFARYLVEGEPAAACWGAARTRLGCGAGGRAGCCVQHAHPPPLTAEPPGRCLLQTSRTACAPFAAWLRSARCPPPPSTSALGDGWGAFRHARACQPPLASWASSSPALAAAAAAATALPCRVILWAQEKIGKSYLVDGKLTGADIADSGAPQRWGIKRPADLLVYVPADVVVTNMEALASAASNAFGPASEALLAQLGSLALPSLAEEEEEEEGGNGGAAAASKPAVLLASRVSQTLVSLGSQRLPKP